MIEAVSQSPRLGSMFPTYIYLKTKDKTITIYKSQSPQIGSMFLTSRKPESKLAQLKKMVSQSPRIGSMFLTLTKRNWRGEMPLQVAIPSNRVNVSHKHNKALIIRYQGLKVAIPSNRVNVSHKKKTKKSDGRMKKLCRNPLESGQCFSLKTW